RGNRCVDVEAVKRGERPLTELGESADAARGGDRNADRRHGADEESRVERQRAMNGDEHKPVLSGQAKPDAGGREDYGEEIVRSLGNGERLRESVEELHPRLAEPLRQGAADPFVNTPDDAAEKVEADEKRKKRDQDDRAADRSAVHDAGAVRKRVPAHSGKADEEGEDAKQVEDPLREHGPQRLGEPDVGAPGQKRRPRYISGADRQHRREHVAGGVGEERRIEAGWFWAGEEDTPADRAEDQSHPVDSERRREPPGTRRRHDPPYVREVAFPEEEPKEEDREERDRCDLESAAQSRAVVPRC